MSQIFELFVCPVSVNKSDFELSACPVSISELAYDLSACSVVTRGEIDGLLVFPASVLETVYALSVSCASVFPRLQSLLWVPDQPVPPWCSPVPS